MLITIDTFTVFFFRLVITTSRSHTDSNVIAAINELQPDEILHVGGAGFKVDFNTYCVFIIFYHLFLYLYEVSMIRS